MPYLIGELHLDKHGMDKYPVKPREFVRHLLRYCIVLIEVIIVCIVIRILYLLCHLYIVDKQLYQFFMLLLPLGDTNALEYTFIVDTQRWTTLKYILSVTFYVPIVPVEQILFHWHLQEQICDVILQCITLCYFQLFRSCIHQSIFHQFVWHLRMNVPKASWEGG